MVVTTATMRSHPYEPPPPFPPILNSLAALIPEPAPTHQPWGDSSDDSVQLSQLDHDTSRLVPEQMQRHHVWIQGKLTPVRSVSAANLSLDRPGSMGVKKRETMRDLETPRRRSMGDPSWPDENGENGLQGPDAAAMRQSTQLRGYGIGGAGNIRTFCSIATVLLLPVADEYLCRSPNRCDSWSNKTRRLIMVDVFFSPRHEFGRREMEFPGHFQQERRSEGQAKSEYCILISAGNSRRGTGASECGDNLSR